MLVLILCAALILGGLLLRHPYFFQDVQHVLYKIKVRRFILKCMRTNYLILDRFLDLVKTQPHKPFIYFKDLTFTYRDADLLSNKAARALLQSGYVKEGDTVALFLENQPMFLWLWLALVKIGCSGTLLNNNIRSKSLLHCLNCTGAKTLVAAEGQEGRAGMAAVTLREGLKFDYTAVFKHVENFLPTYARPRFIRIQVSLDATGTFKVIKTKLVEQGFNPNEITDPLYFLNEKEKNYTALTPDVFDSVIAGNIKI